MHSGFAFCHSGVSGWQDGNVLPSWLQSGCNGLVCIYLFWCIPFRIECDNQAKFTSLFLPALLELNHISKLIEGLLVVSWLLTPDSWQSWWLSSLHFGFAFCHSGDDFFQAITQLRYLLSDRSSMDWWFLSRQCSGSQKHCVSPASCYASKPLRLKGHQ